MIIALAGRRIDAADSETISFPLNNVDIVRKRIQDFFTTNKVSDLLCSGACGADLIAMEVAGDMGIARHMVLPFSPDVFRKTSVTDRPGDWGNIFDTVYTDLSNLKKVTILGYMQEEIDVYEKTNQSMLDLLKPTTSQSVAALVVWDGKPRENATDLTAHFITEAAKRNIPVVQILTV